MERRITSSNHFAVGTNEQFRWLNGIVKAVLVFNLLDALFTLIWVRTGHAIEANALMRNLVNDHAMGFMLAKLGIVGLGSLLLWRTRRRPLAVVSIFVAFLAYYLVLVYHIEYSSFIVRALVRSESLPVSFD